MGMQAMRWGNWSLSAIYMVETGGCEVFVLLKLQRRSGLQREKMSILEADNE